jgi:transcriptional regulator with XRE-family HTH domain
LFAFTLMGNLNAGQRIREVRKRLRLTQTEFARRLGVIQVSVARYEAGRVPRADVLDRIAHLGGVTVGWLLHGQGDRPTPIPSQAARPLPEPLGDLVALLESEVARVEQLPSEYRDRYEKRLREISSRITRELEEYRKVLRADYTTERRVKKKRG